MKTICAFDNVACIVENLAFSTDAMALPAIIILCALIGAYIFASVAKGN